MLNWLHIKNIALIPELELELESGLNILSGETGAGKSIIIDSLNFLLGDRVDKSLIRYGENEALVEGLFVVNSDEASVQLENIGINEKEIIIRRSMSIMGKSDIRINGQLVTQQMLKKITMFLCDIHGQHEHQSLLQSSYHINLLDKFSYNNIKALLSELKGVFDNYKEISHKLSDYGNQNERIQKLDLLKYQINEINSAEIKVGEDEEVATIRSRIKYMEKICSNLANTEQILNGNDNGVTNLFSVCSNYINQSVQYDSSLIELNERFESIKIELNDIADTISNTLESYDYNPRYVEEIERRYDQIKLLKKKYGNTIDEILSYSIKISEEYNNLQDCDAEIEDLLESQTSTIEHMYRLALAISNIRRNEAIKLEKLIVTELQDLGMKGTTFNVQFRDIPSKEGFLSMVNESGFDSIEFLMSPNVGEPQKPLAKIVSGGEMSRIMLALKRIFASIDGIEVLVFDEIDTGISGKIAQVVSEKLSRISLTNQVIAVTHLPQLAAMSDAHYLIEKSVVENKTITHVKRLDMKNKEQEVARLSGGNMESSLQHARDLINLCNNFKNERLNYNLLNIVK